jgi:hypothetical protein
VGEVDFMIELGTRSEAIVSVVSLSSWRGRAQALYRNGNEQKAAVGAGTGILIGTGDLEIVRNAGTPLPQVLNGQENAGAPGEIRTPDLLLRRQSLYPAELRARTNKLVYRAAGKPSMPRYEVLR